MSHAWEAMKAPPNPVDAPGETVLTAAEGAMFARSVVRAAGEPVFLQAVHN